MHEEAAVSSREADLAAQRHRENMQSKRRSECESSTNKKAVDTESGNKSSMCRALFLNAHCLSASCPFPEKQSVKAPHRLFIPDLLYLQMKGSSAEVPKGSTAEGECETGK